MNAGVSGIAIGVGVNGAARGGTSPPAKPFEPIQAAPQAPGPDPVRSPASTLLPLADQAFKISTINERLAALAAAKSDTPSGSVDFKV